MPHWIWEDKDWPNFTWDHGKLQPALSEARQLQGKLLGMMQSFNEDTREHQSLQAMMDEMITTSAIEGSVIDRDSVRSSIYQRLGINHSGIQSKPDRYVEGLLDIMLDAADNYEQDLELNRLSRWHAALFPTGYSGISKILIGQLRGEGDMEIISGRGNKLTVHYLAPPRQGLEAALEVFLQWFNHESYHKVDGIVRAAIAHLWFEKLHPFDDGNGRIGRAIIDLSLAQDEKLSTRFYSVSQAVMQQRKGYYDILEQVSKGDMDVTPWVQWFIQCFTQAINTAFENIELVLQKNKFWQAHEATPINERQRKALNKMLDKGIGGYEGGMSTRKYQAINKVSRATAYRELTDLVSKQCLKPLKEKGRSSAYEINWTDSL